MNIEISFLGIILIISLIIISGITQYVSKKNRRERMMAIANSKKVSALNINFEKDMVPLTTIIEHEYRQYYIYNIKPTFSMGNPLFSEEERLEIVTKLLAQIKGNLSPEYIRYMTYNYLSEDGLDHLIIDLLYNKLNEAVATENFKPVKKKLINK